MHDNWDSQREWNTCTRDDSWGPKDISATFGGFFSYEKLIICEITVSRATEIGACSYLIMYQNGISPGQHEHRGSKLRWDKLVFREWSGKGRMGAKSAAIGVIPFCYEVSDNTQFMIIQRVNWSTCAIHSGLPLLMAVNPMLPGR